MKKGALLFFLIALFIVTIGYSQSITVTSPHSGETWYKGSYYHYTIRWTKRGDMNANVKIRLYQGDSRVLSITDSTPNDGEYEWTIPESVDEGTYKIRVKTIDNAVYDDSEDFSIANPTSSSATITVTSPYSGNVWYKGKVYYIRWTKSGDMNANVKIRLYQGDSRVLSIANSTPNDGLYEWRIPVSISKGTYKIRVRTIDNLVYDDGEDFTIEEASAIGHAFTITSPKAGDVILRSRMHRTITWEDNGSHCDVVSLYLIKYRSIENRPLTPPSLIRNTGVYNSWRIYPGDEGGKYFIKIVSGCDDGVYGKSGIFSILKKSKIQVTKRKDKARDFALIASPMFFKDNFLVVRMKNYYNDFEGNLKFRIIIYQSGAFVGKRDVVKHISIKANETKEIRFRSNPSICGKDVTVIIDPDNEVKETDRHNNNLTSRIRCGEKR